MAYKKLIKVSNVCQLLDKSKYPATQTVKGVTFTNNGDGRWTISGKSTSGYAYYNLVHNLQLNKRHTYLSPYVDLGTCYVEVKFKNKNDEVQWGVNRYTADENSKVDIGCIALDTFDGTDTVVIPQLFDLTEMYGAGHEPTTVEQFRQDFPEEMYDYSPHCWLTSYKRVIVTGDGNYLTTYQRNLTCKTKNLLDINKAYSLGGVNSFDTFSINGNSITATVSNLNSNVVLLRLFLGYLPAGSYCFSCSVSIENSPLDFRPNEFLVFTDDGSIVTVIRGFSNGDHSVNFTFNCSSSGVFRLDFYRNILPIPTESLSDTVYKITFSNIQLELGDIATDYVPYGHL